MIELRDNQLRFAFPEITAALRALVEKHIAAHLPGVLAEDPATALEKLFRNAWRVHARNEEFRREAAEKLKHTFGAEDFARTFRSLAFRAASLSADTPDADAPPELGPARLGVEFQRTLRIPDDGKNYPLPAGLGRFALCEVDDHAANVPARWWEHGGVMMPMYQAEAMWMNFSGSGYPVAVKIAAGKINAVSGEDWRAGLGRQPAQDYVVVPGQPWLDGFAVERGVIRQFVAMPLGGGHSVEEQLADRPAQGGVQVQVYPLRADVYFEEHIARRLPTTLGDVLAALIPVPRGNTVMMGSQPLACCPPGAPAPAKMRQGDPDMGLGAGGRMRQEIYQDARPLSDWDQTLTSRCFVHLCNSAVWREVTGSLPPQPPLTAKEYKRAGLPWFDYYREDRGVLPGSDWLAKVKSVGVISALSGQAPLPGEGPTEIKKVVPVGPVHRPGAVREW